MRTVKNGYPNACERDSLVNKLVDHLISDYNVLILLKAKNG